MHVGVAFHDLAGSVFIDLVSELKEVESIPIMIAIDNYNTWEVPSVYSYELKSIHR